MKFKVKEWLLDHPFYSVDEFMVWIAGDMRKIFGQSFHKKCALLYNFTEFQSHLNLV